MIVNDFFHETNTFPVNYNGQIAHTQKTNLNITENLKKLNLNEASSAELTRVPYIGAATAEKLIYHRNVKKFDTIEEIIEIKGIGPHKYDKLKKYLFVKNQ